MVDTDLIDSFSSNFKDYMPKLKAEDVTAAIMYALGTPDRVQVKSSRSNIDKIICLKINQLKGEILYNSLSV